MHLATFYGAMITGHFYGVDKDDLIDAIGRDFTDRIAEGRAHIETLTRLSPEQKKETLRQQITGFRRQEQELVSLLEQHTNWEHGVHNLLNGKQSEYFGRRDCLPVH